MVKCAPVPEKGKGKAPVAKGKGKKASPVKDVGTWVPPWMNPAAKGKTPEPLPKKK